MSTIEKELEKRILVMRQSLQMLATLCGEEEIEIALSPDAAYFLEKSTLGDEIRSILIAQYPGWMRPNQVRETIENIGHDLKKYANPQATVHMILKRMVEAGEAQETTWPDDGKKIYRIPRHADDWTASAVKESLKAKR